MNRIDPSPSTTQMIGWEDRSVVIGDSLRIGYVTADGVFQYEPPTVDDLVAWLRKEGVTWELCNADDKHQMVLRGCTANAHNFECAGDRLRILFDGAVRFVAVERSRA